MAELNFKAGDEVRIRLAHKEIDGRVLESSDSKIVLLKLESGYNIGIPKENILASRILKKHGEEIKNYPVPVVGKGKKNIGLIITGGTIASKLDSKTGGVRHLVEIGEFRRFYPELFEIVNVKEIEMPFMKASESMNSDDWKKIARTCEKMLDNKEIEGIIVTHGTDFLGYTSAALSFMLHDLGKPIVLTYSQRSIDRASSDASMNLVCAAHMAISDCAEVVLVGHASVNDDFCYAMPGTKVRKMHTSRRDAFKVVNDIPIAKIFPSGEIEFLKSYRKRDNSRKTILNSNFEDKVALLKFYPGQEPEILDYYALKFKGIVIEASGLGHLPVSESGNSWIPRLKKHIKNGLIVCAAAQTIYGRLDPYVYSNGRELVDAGVIFLEDMLAETALVKLGWILGQKGFKGHVKEKMLYNFAGELNDKIGLEEF